LKIFILGKGRVGTAFSKHLKNKNIPFTQCRNTKFSKRTGLIFVAVSDDVTGTVLQKIREKNPEIHIVHFSASAEFTDEKTFLLHPYSSIFADTDISKILFTLWGKKNRIVEIMLQSSGIRFVKAGSAPSLLYHTSAVISGNFTQYFFLAALEMLKKEGFSKSASEKLIEQLITSSVNNVSKHGLHGITGPAARGDLNVIEKETAHLIRSNRELSEVFNNINMLILKAVKNGYLLK
jgi:hypothetical protein